MGRTYTCKECGEGFHRSEHEICPNCGTTPKKSRAEKRMIEPAQEEIVIEASEFNTAGVVDKEKSQKFVVDSVEYYAEVIIINNEATMRFQNQHVAGKVVYCPRCNKRQFDVRVLWGTMERKCDRCGLMITMVFS